MSKKLVSALLLGTLLLVGAGCLQKRAAPAPAAPPVSPPAAVAPTAPPPAAEQPIPTDVDSAVDDIINSIEAEAAADDTTADASALTEDQAEVKAIYDTNYDPQ